MGEFILFSRFNQRCHTPWLAAGAGYRRGLLNLRGKKMKHRVLIVKAALLLSIAVSFAGGGGVSGAP
jgi:hypothetical protein